MRMVKATRMRCGFTLIDLMVVLIVVALLAAVILPILARRYAKPSRDSCVNNLRQVGLAFRTWSGDNGDLFPMRAFTNLDGTLDLSLAANVSRIFQVMSNEIIHPKVLTCPSDIRGPAVDFSQLQNSNISYFVGMDADETMPAMILSGDRNLLTNGVAVNSGLLVLTGTSSVGFSSRMHNGIGDVGLADGSVQSVTSAGLQKLIQRSGTNVVRLGIP